MSSTTKKILRISGWTMVIAGVFVLLGFVGGSQDNMICKELIIKIDEGHGEMSFISEAQVKTKIAENGNQVEGEPMAMLNVSETEAMIREISVVEHAEVYKTIDGKVVVNVWQRHPIVRIINADSTSFYIDENGLTMPLSDHYTARVLVFNGHIQEQVGAFSVEDVLENDSLQAASQLEDVYAIATFINADPFWKAQVQHIWVTPKGEFEIIPRVGNHRIIFGEAKEVENKFTRLKLFYQKALKNQDWNSIATINLKYDNQIVCTKNQ